MEIGTHLYTKNGQHIGNGIVLDIYEKYNLEIYKIKTDFGNIVNLTEKEVERYFISSDDILYPTSQNELRKWLWNRFWLSFKFK